MNELAQALSLFLEKYFTDTIHWSPGAHIRPVLIGPPPEAQRQLFNLLTDNGSRDWQISGVSQDVVVLHVSGSIEKGITTLLSSSSPVSRVCQWDYAVTVRNSRSLVIMLVDPVMWDNRHESLANTTETIGELRIGPSVRELKNTLWAYLIGHIVATTGLNEKDVRDALREIIKQSQALEPSTRDFIVWKVVNDLLAGMPPGITITDLLPVAAGFPSIASTSLSIQDGIRVIRRLGNLIRDEGLKGALERLKDTEVAVNNSLQSSLDALFEHIKGQVFTSTGFERAPAWYYRPGRPVPAWWYTLNVMVLKQILDELEDERLDKLVLKCENALSDFDVPRGEPYIVANAVELRVSAPSGIPVNSPTFSYRIGRSSSVALPTVLGDDTRCVDLAPPSHEKPLKYQVEAPNFVATSIDVLVLNSFPCRGTIRIRDAERNRVPVKSAGMWKQEIALPRSGFMDLNVYYAPGVKHVLIQASDGTKIDDAFTTPGQTRVSFVVEVENNDEVEVILNGDVNRELGRWTVTFTVDETTNTTRSYFEALVGAHQDTKTGPVAVAQPPETLAQYIEREYLVSSESWKPILACWAKQVTISSLQKLDWTNPRLGDTFPLVDSRLKRLPPKDLLEAREIVRKFLENKQRPLGQIYLGEEELLRAVNRYLTSYLDWLTQSPNEATWFDCIAVHDATWSQDSDQYRAGSDPIVMLLSPLHPLRLGWHCLAQQLLNDSLHRRCPAAGLLDPGSCPDIGTWYMNEGEDNFVPRIFFALACENPHWAILLNKDMLDPREERTRVLKRISELGIEAKGVVGGFSRSQAIDSLEEVTRLLPGRSTLRVGIVGTGDGSSACVDGIMDWCERICGQDEEIEAAIGKIPPTTPLAVEIYDLRGNTLYPSSERLATLSENTGEKVKWFKKTPQNFQLDLVILDQLGVGSPRGRDGDARSPIGHGTLFRVRIREDFLDASWLHESRIGKQRPPVPGIAGLLQDTVRAFEKIAESTNMSQFQFQPNREAISSRLEEATFLAVTSSQIDPAGIIRGTKDQKGYLWDYELPGALGGDENSAGYYLIAEPLKAMRNALKRSINLITSSMPDDAGVVELLSEISRRGIPILKRLASGGTEARGELGMLLAVRLLQDAFRGPTREVRLPVWQGDCIHLLLPVDPYQSPFDRLRKVLRISESAQRPDLLVIAVHVPPDGSPVKLKITPVEVKFRTEEMDREEREAALSQAANLGAVLDSIWTKPAQTPLWDVCSTALFVQCLNLAFRVYAAKDVHGHESADWTRIHERVLQDVVSKQADVTVDKSGRLLVFDGSGYSSLREPDIHGQYHTAVLCRDDAKALLMDTGNLSPTGQISVKELKFSFPDCLELGQTSPTDVSSTEIKSSPTLSYIVPATSVQEQNNASSSAVDTRSESFEMLNDSVTGSPTVNKKDLKTDFEPKEPTYRNQIKDTASERRALKAPRAFIGWNQPTSRWSLIGKLDPTGEPVALDLDYPKTIGIFGYMGSGKSYLVGNLIEAALTPISGINELPSPLAVVIFNYRRNASDRFEMSSLAIPNQDKVDQERLANEYSSRPQSLHDIHVLCLPGELKETRREEYGQLTASELFFDPSRLSVDDWELLMGESGSGALFARTIRHVLGELQSAGSITLEKLEEHTLSLLTGQSRQSAALRFKFVRKYISSRHGVKFEQVLKPGRAVIIDLRNQALFSREDALRFFLVCTNQISRVQRRFNKMIIFDEAHEYLSNEFGDKLESLIRLMRHEGTSYLFATQDVASIPPAIRRFIATKFVFSLGTRQNIEDLVRFDNEFKNMPLQGMSSGYCLVQTDQSVGNMFVHPRMVRIRPRVTQHGGTTQIFSVDAHEEEML